MKPIELVVPMSGQGTRYQRAGYTVPKPAIPINGRPMLARLLDCFPETWPVTFVMAENHLATELPALCTALRPQGQQLAVAPHTEGPGRALEAALDHLADDVPVLVTYCDYGMRWDPEAFAAEMAASRCDAALVTYRGFHPHYLSPTKYAYARLERGRVVQVQEKAHFTANREDEHASAGGYFFRTARLLRAALAHQRALGLTLNGEMYTSLTVEALLRGAAGRDADVRVFEVPAFFQWGTPADLEDFAYWERTCAAHARLAAGPHAQGGRMPQTAQVVMPMAGRGSRFGGPDRVPKPLREVAGQTMFLAALESLPQAPRTVLVGLASMREAVARAVADRPGVEAVYLDETPPGQAFSTAAAIARLDPAAEVIVSACDHGVVLDPARWAAFRADPGCDAAAMTVTGYPGTRRGPNAYSYVCPDPGADPAAPFPPIAGIGVKSPATAQPWAEPLVVGTFWFRRADLLATALARLVREDTRVGGEVTLDGVLAVLLAMGRTVRHLPLEGFFCWGDPDSLAEAVYWQAVHAGRTPPARGRPQEQSHAA